MYRPIALFSFLLTACFLVQAVPGLAADSTLVEPGAERHLLSTTVGLEEIRLFPSTQTADLIDLQPGVVDGHFRGGRSGEVGYYYGSIPINNPFLNRSALELEPNMLEAIRVRPGIVDSRYGYGMSGIVLTDPLPVPDQWTARFTGNVGAIVSSREEEFLGREGGGEIFDVSDFGVDRVAYNETVGMPGLGDLQLNIGGPVIGERFGLSFRARYYDSEGHLIARRLFTPEDGIVAYNNTRAEWVVQSTGDEAFVPLGSQERLTLAARAKMRPLRGISVIYDGILQDATRRPYDHDQKYVPGGTAWYYDLVHLHAGSIDFEPGPNTRAWTRYSYLGDTRRSRLYDAADDIRYLPGGVRTGANAFDAGGNDLARKRTRVDVHHAAIGAAHVFQNVHEVRAGVEARLYKMDHQEAFVHLEPGDQPGVALAALPARSIEANPTELTAFLGTTLQIERFSIAAGLRAVGFDPNAEVPLDWTRAQNLYIQNTPDALYFDPEVGDTLRNRRDAEIQSWISPRFEFSFPIRDDTRFRFGAGSFKQMPPLALVYQNMRFIPSAGTRPEDITVYGDPSVGPEQTIQVEMGLNHRLDNGIGIEIALFSKDVKDVVGQVFQRDMVTRGYIARLINLNEATVRGATLSLFRHEMPEQGLAWTLDYSLMFVEGSSSALGESFDRFRMGLSENPSPVRLEWDRRHVVNTSILWRAPEGISAALIGRLQSKLPYQFAFTNRPEYVTLEDNTPVKLLAHARVWYDLPVWREGVQLFLQVDNITDARVTRSVLSDTGMSADLFEKGRHLLMDSEVEGINTIQEYANDRYYVPPRTIRLGLALEF